MKDNIKNLKPYTPGKSIKEIAQAYNIKPENIIKLSSNENPYGFSPLVKKYLKENINNIEFNLYPDALGNNLVNALKEKYPAITNNSEIVVGNGMDQILETLARLLLDNNSEVIIPDLTFSYYGLIANWAGAKINTMTLDSEFNINIEYIKNNINKNTKIIFICSPNNPTGNITNWLEIQEVLKIAQEYNTYVFVDEAYIEFSNTESVIKYSSEYNNLIIGRTFSKLYGLANLRVGWAVIPQELVSGYRKVQTPFVVNGLGLQSAIISLNDTEFINSTIQSNKQQRDYLTQELNKLKIKVFPSQANFVMCQVSNANELCEKLLQQGIIIRNVSKSFPLAPNNLIRITIGTQEQNTKLIQVLQEIL